MYILLKMPNPNPLIMIVIIIAKSVDLCHSSRCTLLLLYNMSYTL